jgi:hypothetical protein
MSNVICFHNPDEPNGFLSNWYKSNFTADGITFNSVEQYMMYQKAITFNDQFIANRILESNNVKAIKALGRKVVHYDEKTWSDKRFQVVLRGNYFKFKQNPELCQMLKNTGNAILAECAVHDKIWGIGLSMSSPNRFYPERWSGQNLLGKALMQIRHIL